MTGLLWIALGTLVSEDLTCLATGVLIAQGMLGFWSGTLACLLGIYAGDLGLYALGRLAGRIPFKWRPARTEQASAWLTAKGPVVILLSRFTPGLRLPTYFVAGALKTPARRFAMYFLAAAAIWTPLLVGAAALFGARSARWALMRTGRASLRFAIVLVAIWSLHWLVRKALSFRVRRRVLGFVLRKIRWEFWPVWAAYLPVIPYILWLAVRHRSATLFTAANPGMPSGGFAGESKSQILDHLSRHEGIVARYELIPQTLPQRLRMLRARDFMERIGAAFPVVLKPDVGERGRGVAVVRSLAQMSRYLSQAGGDTIIQEYVEGKEFGVFYYRYPGEARGRVYSITEKRFPAVTGDGSSTIEDLILRDARAVCMARAYLNASRLPANHIPAGAEQICLVEIGSHCRGSIFLDARHLNTAALEEAIGRISKAHPGFYFGRYDVRAPSIEAFQSGQFTVIELNGVSAEATHIYDPAVSLREAYRSLYAQWRIAFEIGALNRNKGAQPMTVAALVQLIWHGAPKRAEYPPVPASFHCR